MEPGTALNMGFSSENTSLESPKELTTSDKILNSFRNMCMNIETYEKFKNKFQDIII